MNIGIIKPMMYSQKVFQQKIKMQVQKKKKKKKNTKTAPHGKKGGFWGKNVKKKMKILHAGVILEKNKKLKILHAVVSIDHFQKLPFFTNR